MAAIELRQVRKSFGATEIIRGVDLSINSGEFVVFVGPSGSGKSTLLRMITGLETLSGGEIWIGGRRADELVPHARGLAMVFQSYALYPHMTVRSNLKFGLENQRLPADQIASRVAYASQILQIEHLLDRRPHQLSGGQSQRVAIGRAIVKEPKAFLFDEPLSNLDAELRVKMRSELVLLHNRLKSTMIYVTHDQVEAMTMADRIVVLKDGQVQQVGSPVEIYARPVNRFVAGFMGAPSMNMFAATCTKGAGNQLTLTDTGVTISVPDLEPGLADRVATVGIRPEHFVVDDDGDFRMLVRATEVLGSDTIVVGADPSGKEVLVAERGILELRSGDHISCVVDPRLVHLFDADGHAIARTSNWRDIYVKARRARSPRLEENLT
jgi:multiple sugar transport system ATP-binding protein